MQEPEKSLSVGQAPPYGANDSSLSFYDARIQAMRRALAEIRRDTSEKETEIVRAMTPEQKLKVSFGLYRTAWRLKEAYMRKVHPDWSEEQIRTAMREAFLYGES